MVARSHDVICVSLRRSGNLDFQIWKIRSDDFPEVGDGVGDGVGEGGDLNRVYLEARLGESQKKEEEEIGYFKKFDKMF